MGSGESCLELDQLQKGRGGRAKEARQRAHAEHTYDIFARKMAGMSPEEGAAILRPSPKGYKAHARAGTKVRREHSSAGQGKCAGTVQHTGFYLKPGRHRGHVSSLSGEGNLITGTGF